MTACKHCSTELVRKRWGRNLEAQTAFSKRVYCDRECTAKGMEKAHCSSVSHSRRKANKSLKPACEECWSTGKRHQHHRDENPHNNDPQNLKTLCVTCHRLAHSPNFTGTGAQRRPCEYCGKPSMKRGWCFTHLSRFKRFGHPLAKKQKIGYEWVLMLHDGKSWLPFHSLREREPESHACGVTAMQSVAKPLKSG